jgi:hypothetical protein
VKVKEGSGEEILPAFAGTEELIPRHPTTTENHMSDDKRQVSLPPLRPYEMPDTPVTALDIPAEKDTFIITGERMTADELRSMARPVTMPPLHPAELPDSMVSVLKAEPDSRLDDREWGTAKRMPEITIRKGNLLHPWDD